jgi:hypothetical protein
MRIRSRMTAAALAVAAAAIPAFAQQEPPAAGQAPAEANGPTPPPQKAPAAEAQQPQAARDGTARFALVTANVNLRSRPGKMPRFSRPFRPEAEWRSPIAASGAW